MSDLQLSTFVAAVYAADLDRFVKKTPGVSYFMPRNRAFSNLGLGMKYLLLPEGKDELRKVIRYHVVDSIVYSGDMERGAKAYRTLEGGDIVVRRAKVETLHSRCRVPPVGKDTTQAKICLPMGSFAQHTLQRWTL